MKTLLTVKALEIKCQPTQRPETPAPNNRGREHRDDALRPRYTRQGEAARKEEYT